MKKSLLLLSAVFAVSIAAFNAQAGSGGSLTQAQCEENDKLPGCEQYKNK